MNDISAAPTDPQALAEAVAESMMARDHASLALGMRIERVAPGAAELQMTVRRDMLNGHGTCHGGLITALADSAFAFACNSRNVVNVASGFNVDLLLPAREGDLLSARCRELHCGGRLGVFDCEVFNQRGERIATFRGHSYALKGRSVIDSQPIGMRASNTAPAVIGAGESR